MSMNAEFVQVDPAELERMKKNPAWAESLFHSPPSMMPPSLASLSQVLQDRMRASGPRLMADVLAQMNPEMREQMEARLGITTEALASGQGGELLLKVMEERRQRLAAVAPGMFPVEPGMGASASAREKISLDKAWHGVHYVLCGAPEPGPTLLSQAILGGTDIGDEEEGFSGYGPARYFTAAQVVELARTLSRPELETEAAERFDPERMAELELYPGWEPKRAQDDREWIMSSFRRLRDFVVDASGKGRAIVTCLV